MPTCPNIGEEVVLTIGDNTYTFVLTEASELQGDGNYRWCYSVAVETVQQGGLSHFVIEFCPTVLEDNLVRVLVDGEEIPEDAPGTEGDTFEFGTFTEGEDEEIYGLKINFDPSLETGGRESAVICFDLNADFLSAPGDVAIKPGGPDSVIFEDVLCVPCVEVTRGILI